ncbi:GNAT family N-acetyltransferase [Streptomyces sp. CBMA29]|uniref:GNAT family N-acetyltransferase n=1 Tax=Streptomyces sp. CBMA29 TaxID=1896314 RepID=UPI001661F2EB|nr:GNAT family N-acetyltransferase [Streptomyces sp. CBMA29]MBD0736958.1 GNAT family N-acetyltransferase [Streptomyces sp. CBMA29]
MRFRWDWLRPVVTAPYVPTIGPVHPSVLTDDLFADTLRAAGSRRFLPYDKDLRWSGTKDESVLTDAVVHRPGETLIPTHLARGAGTIKVYAYGVEPGSHIAAAELAQKLAADHGASRARIVRFLGPEYASRFAQGVRIQLKDFSSGACPPPARPLSTFADLSLDLREDFASFSEEMANDGFAFLYTRMQANAVGPVLVATTGGQVAGAIGPMEIRPDAIGRTQLMPQYFGVRTEHRGHGFGRALWRAAMRWGQENGAAYQLLQTEVGGASDSLCQAEGLTSLGFVVTTTAR